MNNKNEKPNQLTAEDRERYQRHLIIPEIGVSGQEKLARACVFIAGLGGLGSISAYYLVAAGFGKVILADRDTVSLSNLNRQILHGTIDIDKPKAKSASEKLRNLNPRCEIVAVRAELDEDNMNGLLDDAMLIVDATDNIKTRKLLNRYSQKKSIPMIYGGVDGFSGMVSTFIPGETGCFNCLYPDNPSAEKTVGVIGPAVGVVASIQSLEAVKYITGAGNLLKNRLLIFQGLDMRIDIMEIDGNPDCPVCAFQSSTM